MSDKLEACPFCGTHLRKMSEGQGYWHPVVGTCPLSGWEMQADGYAEDRWNRRTPTPEQAGEVEPVAWLYEKNGRQSIQMKRQPWNTEPDRGWTETALFASTPPAQPTADAVERAARIIDPGKWDLFDLATAKGLPGATLFVEESLEKAREIAALPATMAGDYVMVPRADALAQALCLLDTFAGEGLTHTYGNGQVLDAADVCTELAEAYGIQCEPGWWRTVADRAASPTGGE